MTNEEKARELSNKWGVENCVYGDNSWYECHDAALEMAEWKDHQVREILRKTWKESQVNPNNNELRIALFVDKIMDIFLGEDYE